MMKRYSKVSLIAGALILLCLLVQPATAQNHWLRSAEQNSITLDIFKPSIDADGVGFFTSLIYLSGYIEATDQLAVIIEFPIANADIEGTFTDYSETSFGNLYLGMEYKIANLDETRAGVFRLGFRPPIASDEKYAAAEVNYIGLYDRFEAVYPDLSTIAGGGGYHWRMDNGFGIDADINGSLMLPGDGDNELFIDYNLTFWLAQQQLQGGMGFAGRMIATQDDLDFSERTIHQLGFFGSYDFGQFKPGIHFRLPIDDDLNDILNFTWGISLMAEFE